MGMSRVPAVLVFACCVPLTSFAFAPVQAPTPGTSSAFVRVYPVGAPGLTDPVVVKLGTFSYTTEAMRAKIQGIVELEVTIAADGTVRDALVTKSLDAATGMDDQAVIAAGKSVFKPGRLNGSAVAVRTKISLKAGLH